MRKNCFRTLLAALLIASFMSATAFAETALVTAREVNVRSGPGPDYAILGSYSRGSSVEVISRGDGQWYAVNYNGTIGYMSADYLSLQQDGSGTIIPDTPAQAEAAGGQAVVFGGTESPSAQIGTGRIIGTDVRFRSGPSTDSAILGEYDEGKEIAVLGTEGDWTLCLIDGQYGYIYSQYLSVTAAVYATPTPSGNLSGLLIGQGDMPQQAPGSGQSIVIDYPAPSPAVTPSPTPVLVTPVPTSVVVSSSSAGQAGIITGDYVRFRRGPGTDYSIIRSCDRGQALTILAIEGDWVSCTIEGVNGYVFRQYVQTLQSAPEPSGGNTGTAQTAFDPLSLPAREATLSPIPTASAGSPGYIKGNNVRFRASPDLSSEIIGELFYGNVVTITGSDGTWTSIICSGRAGYVFSQYVAPGTLQTVSTSGSATGREVADYALQLVGTPYRWGGVDPSTGFDCSGFVYYVYKHFGYTLNRVASEQALNGRHVEASEMQPGDLLCFYSGGSYIGHVGIYIGNNLFVHAATSSTGVIASELTGYYASRGFEVRRILN